MAQRIFKDAKELSEFAIDKGIIGTVVSTDPELGNTDIQGFYKTAETAARSLVRPGQYLDRDLLRQNPTNTHGLLKRALEKAKTAERFR